MLKSWLPHDDFDMQGANAQLRGRVQELATELQGATDELAVLQQLRNELEGSASPRVESIVNAAVARERSLQEARNRKVLELLNSKVGTLDGKHGKTSVKAVEWPRAAFWSSRLLLSQSGGLPDLWWLECTAYTGLCLSALWPVSAVLIGAAIAGQPGGYRRQDLRYHLKP